MSRLRVGDLGDSTHNGLENYGHVKKIRGHPEDGLADSLWGRYRLLAQEDYRLHIGWYSSGISGGTSMIFFPKQYMSPSVRDSWRVG